MNNLLSNEINENIVNINDVDTVNEKYLTFAIDKELYCIKIGYVREIIGIQQITQVPNQLDYIKGVINLRGKIIPTMDIRKRFEKEEREYDDRTCIVVINIDDLTVGVVVDRVLEVINLMGNQIYNPPQANLDVKSKYISGIAKLEDQVIMLLNCEKIIIQEKLEDQIKSIE